MKYLAALLLLYSHTATPVQMDLKWWESAEFGRCTKTDVIELGGCGLLEVRSRPDWGK